MFKRIKDIIISFKNKLLMEYVRPPMPPRTQDHWLTHALNNKDTAIICVNKSRPILQKYHPTKTWYDDELPSIFFMLYDHITKVLKYNVVVKKRGDCNDLFVTCYITDSNGLPVVRDSSIEIPERSYSIAILRTYCNLLYYENLHGK